MIRQAQQVNYVPNGRPKPPSLLEKIGGLLFPGHTMGIPEPKDWIARGKMTLQGGLRLPWKLRIRLLLSGKLLVTTLVLTEENPARYETTISVDALPPNFLKYRHVSLEKR